MDADNKIAALEEQIRRRLTTRPLKTSLLKRQCNAYRAGLWAWEKALDNLVRAKEAHYDPQTDTWSTVHQGLHQRGESEIRH